MRIFFEIFTVSAVSAVGQNYATVIDRNQIEDYATKTRKLLKNRKRNKECFYYMKSCTNTHLCAPAYLKTEK